MKDEKMIRAEAFGDGMKYNEYIREITMVTEDLLRFNHGFDQLKNYRNWTKEDYDTKIEIFKEKFYKFYGLIEKLGKTNLEILLIKIKNEAKRFEKAHKNLCYHVAGLKLWGEE